MATNPPAGRRGGGSGGSRGGDGGAKRASGKGGNGGGRGGQGGNRRGGSGGGGKPGGKGGRPVGKGGRPEPQDPTEALRERLTKVLSRLPETQRKVLEYRMGLVDGHPKKLGETATALGISMSEAKQIEERAFAHIRDAIPIQHLQKFLGQ